MEMQEILDHEYTIDNMSKLKILIQYIQGLRKKKDEFNNSSQTKHLKNMNIMGKNM